MDEFSLQQLVEFVQVWVVTYLFSIERMTQYGVILLGFTVAYFATKYIRKALTLLPVEQKHRSVKALMYRIGRRMAFPFIMVVWIFAFELGYSFLGQPHLVLSSVKGLILAFAIIRFASSFIDNPLISRTVASIVWVIAALKILGYLPQTIKYLDGITLGIEKDSLSLYDITFSTLAVGATVWIALIVSSMLEKIIANNRNLSLSAKALFGKLAKFLLITIAFLTGLKIVGINLTTFAVFGGAIGVGIGLGLQKVFSNLIAGIILLMDRSIKPGDTIVANGEYGKVNHLSARYVSMITRNGTEHLIPNDELINHPVENWSYSNQNVRLKIPIGVHYQSDVKLAMKLCIEAASETWRVLKDPGPVCLLKEFGDNSVNFELRFWIKDPMSGCSNVKSEVLLKVWEKFHQNHIEIPYPQRDLHIRSSAIGHLDASQ